MSLDTLYIKTEIMDKDNLSDAMKYIFNENDRFVDWKKYINELLQVHGCSYEKFGKMTGFSKNTIKSWCVNGTLPRSRQLFIKLAFGLKMDIEETNELLYKYGRYSKLYAKDLHDAIIIYVISKRVNNWNDERYSYDSLEKWEEKFENILKRHNVDSQYYFKMDTVYVYNDIKDQTDDEDFEQYVINHSDVFLSSYSSLIGFIEDFIRIRTTERNDAVDNSEKYSWHRLLKEKKLDSSFDIMLSRLKHDGVLPKREQLIAMGIHLNMTSMDIDKMLSLANMHELYARDKAESLLLYLLRNADEFDPDMQFNNALKYVSSTSDKKIRKEYQQIVDMYYGLEEDEWENSIDDLAEYIRNELVDISAEEIIRTYLKI